ncbi:MAG: mechanosensitive ion channel family protein [Raineya sp.]|nr:mechanosensitive ion channel family protein [Raineya sp.]
MFEWVNHYFEGTILENKPSQIAAFLAFVLVAVLFKGILAPLILRLISKIFIRKIESDKNVLTNFILFTQKSIKRFLVFLFFYIAFQQLRFPKSWNLAPSNEFGLHFLLDKSYQIFLVVLFTLFVLRVINFWGLYFLQKAGQTESRMDDHIIPYLKEIAKVMVVLVILVFTLSKVLNLNVNAIITGLGIGGLAVALAGKETLENLFASFTIFLDKPFITGDLVKVDNIIGRVEKVGFRTTRIRTVERSVITLPNKTMVDKPVDNLTNRVTWRAFFEIELTYQTPMSVLKTIKEEIYDYLHQHTRTDENSQVFFSDFGPHSLKMQIYYFVVTNDFFDFMRVKEEINFKIHEIVTRNGAEFAFPTRTIFVKNEEKSLPNS